MTDYLLPLLDELLQEEPQETGWKYPQKIGNLAQLRSMQRERFQEMTPAEAQATQSATQAERPRVQALWDAQTSQYTTLEGADAEASANWRASPEAWAQREHAAWGAMLEALPRPTSSRVGGVQLSPARVASPVPMETWGQGAGLTTVRTVQQQAVGEMREVGVLDKLFQRDARRYDGGFTLF